VLWHVTRFLRGFFMIWVFFSLFADFWLEVHIYFIAGLTMLLVNRRLDPPPAAEVSAARPLPSGGPVPALPAPGTAG
jgi:hypothetical protein